MNVSASASAVHASSPRRSSSWSSYLVFTLSASLFLLPFMGIIRIKTDEGELLSGAVRIAQGQVFARDFIDVMGPGTFYWLAAFNLIGVLRAHPVMTRVGSVAVFKDDPVLAFISTHVAAGEEMFVFPYYSMYCFLSAFSCKACETPRYVICRNEANCAADSTH